MTRKGLAALGAVGPPLQSHPSAAGTRMGWPLTGLVAQLWGQEQPVRGKEENLGVRHT